MKGNYKTILGLSLISPVDLEEEIGKVTLVITPYYTACRYHRYVVVSGSWS